MSGERGGNIPFSPFELSSMRLSVVRTAFFPDPTVSGGGVSVPVTVAAGDAEAGTGRLSVPFEAPSAGSRVGGWCGDALCSPISMLSDGVLLLDVLVVAADAAAAASPLTGLVF